jgi:rod shape-determining protein MreC
VRRLTRRQRRAFVVLALVALAFVSLDVAGTGLRGLHGGFAGTFGSLYRGTDAVFGPARRFVQGVPSAGSAQSRIAALERDNAALRAQVAQGAATGRDSAQLDQLNHSATANGYRIVPARVTALGPGGGFEWTTTIDAGSERGVAVDQTVTDGNALVGRVISVTSGTAVVLLAADPGSGVGVRDTRSGQLAVATGAGTGGFTVVPLDPKADLKDGDELRSGPAGQSSYVPGLAIGTVTGVRATPDGAVRAAVKPALSPTGLDIVGVIVSAGPTTLAAPR